MFLKKKYFVILSGRDSSDNFFMNFPCCSLILRSNGTILKYANKGLVVSCLFLNFMTLTGFLRLLLTLFSCVLGTPHQASIHYSMYGLMNAFYVVFNCLS